MISVIGAGPAGSFYSSIEKHDEVHLFEEHKKVGEPFSCSGILTSSINELIKVPDEIILNKIKQFKIVAPNCKSLYIPLKKPNLIVDRTKFDQWLFEKAKENATIHLNEKFIGYKKEKLLYKIKTTKGSYETHMLVGADGVNSQVAKSANIFRKRNLRTGLQSRCQYKELEEGTTTIFLDKGDFSWIIPENDKIARVGVIGKTSPLLWKQYKELLGDSKIIQNISGGVPVFDPKQALRKPDENIFLIGDCATQLKATTYGGILYGLHAAKLLAQNKETYVKNFENINKELKLSLKIRDLLDSMTEKQKNQMVKIFSSKRNSKILSSHDRDYPSKFLFKLLLDPRVGILGLNILKNRFLAKKTKTVINKLEQNIS